MIEAEVYRNDQLIMSKNFYQDEISLEGAIKLLEMYIVDEQLNNAGECFVRVRYANLNRKSV